MISVREKGIDVDGEGNVHVMLPGDAASLPVQHNGNLGDVTERAMPHSKLAECIC